MHVSKLVLLGLLIFSTNIFGQVAAPPADSPIATTETPCTAEQEAIILLQEKIIEAYRTSVILIELFHDLQQLVDEACLIDREGWSCRNAIFLSKKIRNYSACSVANFGSDH